MAVEQQTSLPDPTSQAKIGETEELNAQDIVDILNGYRREADTARRTGPEGRDDIWKSNVNLYWNRFDYSKKASWQSKEAMPEAPMFVDRWAAAMREALLAAGEWFTVVDPADKENNLSVAIKKFIQVWLARCGRNQSGQPMPFDAVFEEQMKLAAMMAGCAAVTWKEDAQGRGYIAVDDVDPREFWLDPTGRGLYRVRRYQLDFFRLQQMKGLKDGEGSPIFNIGMIDQLERTMDEEHTVEKEELAGHSRKTSTQRRPINIDEYLCTLLDREGNKVADNVLCVVANERFLIRGPEKNPFWHKMDWIVYAPAITVPLSVYGRTYMENWSSVARTFVELTNLLLDATFTQSMNAFAMVPDMLQDPAEANEGVHPNKTFMLEEGADARMFLQNVQLGSLPTSSVTIWQALKNELREGAAFSEIALGQLTQKSDTTATEVSASQQNSASLLRSIARTIEARFLEPILDLMWKLGLQHMRAGDEDLMEALGEENFSMFLAQRKALVNRRITFRARGLSALIERQQKLRTLLQTVQVLGSNPLFAQVFFTQVTNPQKLIETLLRYSGVDLDDLRPTARETQIAAIAQSAQQMQPQTGSPPAPQPPTPGEV